MKAEVILETFEDFVISLPGYTPADPKGEYEVLRYSRSRLGIVYRPATGRRLTLVGQAEDDYKLMQNAKPLSAISSSKRASAMRRLILRDGNNCWFCGYVPLPNELLTIEHLLARKHGGNHKVENLALACVPCNTEADDLPITQKVKLRELKRGIK